jgi:hypothetical protein
LALPEAYRPRLAQMAREGVRYTAQAFQQMGPAQRHSVMVATLRELEATLTDAALAMFRSLVGRAHLRAKKRVEEAVTVLADQGRERLARIADVLDALVKAARKGGDVAGAVTAVAALDTIEADAALIRQTTRQSRPDVLGELVPEHRVFKQTGPRFLASFTFEGGRASAPLLAAIGVLRGLGGDRRRALPANLPLGHVEGRWRHHVGGRDGTDRTYYELATFFALSDALVSGDVWVPASRLHRSLDDLLALPAPPATTSAPPQLPTATADAYLAARAAELNAALLGAAHGLSSKDAKLFAGGKLRFPKEPKPDDTPGADAAAGAAYRLVPHVRLTDLLEAVDRWTGFASHFKHVKTGLPPSDTRAFLATLIAEATNLGLARMAEVCEAASRRALLRMLTWHMREDTFPAALGCLTDAIHAEPLSAWFGEGWRASADGQGLWPRRPR